MKNIIYKNHPNGISNNDILLHWRILVNKFTGLGGIRTHELRVPLQSSTISATKSRWEQRVRR